MQVVFYRERLFLLAAIIVCAQVLVVQSSTNGILQNVETVLIPVNNEILSKVCVTESKIDNLDPGMSADVSELFSKVCVVDSKVDEITGDCDLTTIESKVNVVECKIDDIDVNLETHDIKNV